MVLTQSLIHKSWLWMDQGFITKIIAFNSCYEGDSWIIKIPEKEAVNRFLEQHNLSFAYRRWLGGYDVFLDLVSQPIIEQIVADIFPRQLQNIVVRGYRNHIRMYEDFLGGEEGCCPFCGYPCLLNVFYDDSGDTVLCFHCHNFVSVSHSLNQEREYGNEYCPKCQKETPHVLYLKAGLYGGGETWVCKECDGETNSVAL